MRISDWSSDVCSSDLAPAVIGSDTNNDARFDDCTPFGRPDALPRKGAPVAMRIFADNISRAFLPRAGEEAEEASSLRSGLDCTGLGNMNAAAIPDPHPDGSDCALGAEAAFGDLVADGTKAGEGLSCPPAPSIGAEPPSTR